MPRSPRVIVPGVAHHVTQRGNNRQPVFFTPDDRSLYLWLLAQHAAAKGVHVLGYCLMTNHVHLVVVPDREDSLARTLGATHTAYAQWNNHKRATIGHLWQARYFSCPMDAIHFQRAMLYVDLNPVRAGFVADAREWHWSSARAHAASTIRDPLLDADWIDLARGWDHESWRERLASCQPEEDTIAVRQATHRGIPLGSSTFVEELELRTGRRFSFRPQGRPKKGTVPFS